MMNIWPKLVWMEEEAEELGRSRHQHWKNHYDEENYRRRLDDDEELVADDDDNAIWVVELGSLDEVD
jgi:hypothetical protein